MLLASLPPDQAERVLARAAPEPITSHTIVDRTRLAEEVARAREQGYAVVDQELELGLRTIAVPVKNFRGDVVAAMNISVHAGRMSVAQMIERCLPTLIKYQVELNALL
jgi:IclR family pca regulon transcriptional regulator